MGIPQMKNFCSITAVLCMTTNCLLCMATKNPVYMQLSQKLFLASSLGVPMFCESKATPFFQRLICDDRKRWWGEVKRLSGLCWIYRDVSNNISIDEID